MFNTRAGYGADVRRAFSGKDSLVTDASTGEILCTVESFNAQVNFQNSNYMPLGSAQTQEFMTSFSVTIAITQFVIQDDQFIRDAFDFFQNHRHAPMWNFAGTIFGYNGSRSQMIFRDCVPSGQWDLMNLTTGDIIKRQLNLHVNCPPDLQSILSFS